MAVGLAARTHTSLAFRIVNSLLLALLALTCLLPVVHVLALSLSSKFAVSAGKVLFWPVDFHVYNYYVIYRYSGFLHALLVSVERTVMGAVVNMTLIVLTAYPLSRDAGDLKGRNILMWFFVVPLLFGGGLIPYYILVKDLGLRNTFWVMIVPQAVQIWSVIIMMNAFRNLPKPLYESATMDGASHMTVLTRIFLPLTRPVLATLLLFSMVGHWNSWFDAMIFINNPRMHPLQTIIQSLLAQAQVIANEASGIDRKVLELLSDRSLIAAQIFIATLPILCVYPFLQKHFVKGIVLGAVKE